jgi:hypothetical protein
MLRSQASPGRKPARWDRAMPRDPDPPTPEEKAFKSVLAFDPQRMSPEDVREVTADVSPGIHVSTRIKQGLDQFGGVPPSVRRAIDGLRFAVDNPASTDEQRKKATVDLERIANEAESDKVRAYASSVGLSSRGAEERLSREEPE